MPEPFEEGDIRSIVAGTVTLTFRRVGDRWAHSIQDTRGDHEDDPRRGSTYRMHAVTLEGDPARDDPARVVSPAYQDFQFQRSGAIVQALLVGQSGPHHFSAVFAVEDRERGGAMITVDVADRCRAPVEALASTYTVNATSGELVEAGPSLVSWDLGREGFGTDRLTFGAVAPAQVAMAEAGRRATQVQALAGPESASSTRRLRYYWHWQSRIRD